MLSRTLWLSAWFPVFLVAPLVAQRASPVERQLIAAGLWAEARYNYAYWDAVRANWDSAFAATVTATQARPASTDLQYLHRLRRWGALLNDGQLEILPPSSIANRIARPPLELRSIERRPFIMDYAVNDEMRVARPERLAEVSAANDASRWERAVARMLEGERGTALLVVLRLPGGAERGASLTRSVPLAARWPMEPHALEVDTLPDGAIWVRVTSFVDPDVVSQFDRAIGAAVREGPRHRGLIVDLREATWTVDGRDNSYALLSRLIERPFLSARQRMPLYRPDSTSLWVSTPSGMIWPPPTHEHAAYTGPVAVLMSPRTSGPAEDFLVAFQAGGRGPTFGEWSAGSTGQTVVRTLSSGWKVRVTAARDAFPDGKEFVPTGIAPQIPVAVRVEDVLAGRDAVLERARAYLTDAARR